MDEIIKDPKLKGDNYYAYRVLSEDLVKISQYCNEKCLTEYSNIQLTKKENDCLIECSKKLLEQSVFSLSVIKSYK